MANSRFTQFMYSKHVMPAVIDCQFTVTPTDATGVTGLKGPGVSAVYMASSTTSTDPIFEPADGIIHVKLMDNYNKVLAVDWNAQPPVTGSSISISGSTVLTQGVPYQIVTLGTSTDANWQAAGLPSGVSAAVGQAFIAKITGGGTGTGTVKALGIGGIASIEVCGNPSLATLYPTGASNTGGWLILQSLAATSSSVTTLLPVAPTTGTVITLKFFLSNSSVTVAGE